MPTTIPGSSELEVSIFGPGVGECIVVHVGEGKWIVVDSCLNPGTKRPVALEYLESLGVAVDRDVAVVLVSHWHDDHTRGVSEVLDACAEAEFFCSAALRREEFFDLVAIANRLALKAGGGSGVGEMAAVFSLLKARRTSGKTRVVSPNWVAADRIVYRRAATASFPGCSVEALSPSSTSQTRGVLSFALVDHAPKLTIPNPGPNELSVALHIQVGSVSALLGADLEIGSSDEVGWRAVVNNPRRPPGRVSIVKVPHHGSSGADHHPVWRDLVLEDARAGVTPFNSSQLPRDTDIARIKSRTPHLFHSSPKPPREVRLDRTTARTIEGIKISERHAELGHIRFRVGQDGQVHYHLMGAARVA